MSKKMYCQKCKKNEKAISLLRKNIDNLRSALADCMRYVDVDNLTMQTKYARWRDVLSGNSWNPSNTRIDK